MQQSTEYDTTSKRTTFGSTVGIVVCCLGSVVGTGNIWRFPRIAATNSSPEGGLSFIITWTSFLLLWSMPMILAEYGMGRYAKGGPVVAMQRFIGPRAGWCGLWVSCVTFLIMCYYIVIQGWCFYFLYYSIATDHLPSSAVDGWRIFDEFSHSKWPILTQGLGVLLAAICTVGGLNWIEKANLVIIPILLLILLFTFGWALSLPFSELGIKFLFTPNWGVISSPTVWLEGAVQNAFDTSAALGLFLTYASYMTSGDGVVKFSLFIPFTNNLVSLLCGITIFATAFSTFVETEPFLSQTGIVEILKTTGPGSTGLTFVWMPVLFGRAGMLGRILCCSFFLCLSFAGLSSTISIFEMAIVTCKELGVPNRKVAAILISIVAFGIGFGSAWSTEILNNQDFVWGFAILISGLFLQFAVIYFGVLKFRSKVINEYSFNDWNLPYAWAIIIQFIAPLEAFGLIAWWIYDLVSSNPMNWYRIESLSLTTVLIEWLGLLLVVLIVNFVMLKCKSTWNDNCILESGDPVPLSKHRSSTINAVDNDIYNCWDNPAYTRSDADLRSGQRVLSVRSAISEERTVL